MSLSHMSLIVQPAPLIKKLPSANSVNIFRSGRQPGAAAKLMLQVHGRNNNHVPGHDAKREQIVLMTVFGNSSEIIITS